MSTTYTPCQGIWHNKVRHDCCPKWASGKPFLLWAGLTRTGRSLRRRDDSLPYSPENCFWADNQPRGDAFIKKVVALRVSLLGETREQAEDWFASVSHQRRYFWFSQNKAKVAS